MLNEAIVYVSYDKKNKHVVCEFVICYYTLITLVQPIFLLHHSNNSSFYASEMSNRIFAPILY